MRHLDREIDLETEDWSKADLRNALEHAISHIRLWFRKNPGPEKAAGLAGCSAAPNSQMYGWIVSVCLPAQQIV